MYSAVPFGGEQLRRCSLFLALSSGAPIVKQQGSCSLLVGSFDRNALSTRRLEYPITRVLVNIEANVPDGENPQLQSRYS